MNFWVSLLIIFGFLGVAVFGVLAMDHGRIGGCLATIANGGFCPNVSNLLELISFYSGIFKSFSMAVLGQQALMAFLIILFMIEGALGRVTLIRQTNIFNNLCFLQNRFPERAALVYKKDFISWLALHENSPAYFRTRG